MDQQEILVAVGFAGMVATWLVLVRRSLVRSRSSAAALATTAQARGWSYQEQDRAPIDVGEIFNEENRGVYRHVVRGSAADTSFVAFEYVPPTNGLHGFVLVNLPKFLPTLEVRPAGSIQRAARGTEYGLPLVRFESADFNARFFVQASDAKFASDVMTPRLMQALTAGPPLTWRIMDGALVSWSDSPLTALQIVSSVPTLRLILDAIPGFVWERYASAQPTPFSAATLAIATSNPAPMDTATPLPGQPARAQSASMAPGWYPDPAEPAMARWWNGSGWTSNRAKIQVR